MPAQQCPVFGCGKRSNRWGPKSHPLPSPRVFTLLLDEQLSLHPLNKRVCQPCWKRDKYPSMGLGGRVRVTPVQPLNVLLSAISTDASSMPTAPDSSAAAAVELSSPPDTDDAEPSTSSSHAPPPLPALESPLAYTALPSLRASSTPFTSLRAVLDDVYSHGLSHWSLQAPDFPLTRGPHAIAPPSCDKLAHTKAHKHAMPLVTFNLPERRVGQRSSARRAEVQTDPLSLLREQRTYRTDGFTVVWYEKDNGFNGWKVGTKRRRGTDSHSGSRKRQQTAAAPATPASLSPLNPLLFCLEPDNLSSIMQFAASGEAWHFPGFSSPFWYRKTPGTFFCMHPEQLHAPFYNLCYEGGTTWWVVRREHRNELDAYVAEQAKQCYGVAELTSDEAEAVRGLLYTKQVVFHPEELLAAGVPLTRIEQVAGTVVVGDGDLIHFGTTAVDAQHPSKSRSVNEAVNFLPVRWLTTGLPRLVRWLEWLQRAWLPIQREEAEVGGEKALLRAALQDARTSGLLAQHCSPHWCHELLRRLTRIMSGEPLHSERYGATRRAIEETLSGVEKAAVVRRVSRALTVMDSGDVKGWLLKYSIMDGATAPETDYYVG